MELYKKAGSAQHYKEPFSKINNWIKSLDDSDTLKLWASQVDRLLLGISIELSSGKSRECLHCSPRSTRSQPEIHEEASDSRHLLDKDASIRTFLLQGCDDWIALLSEIQGSAVQKEAQLQ